MTTFENIISSKSAKLLAFAVVGSVSFIGPYIYEQEERRKSLQAKEAEQPKISVEILPTSTPDFGAIEDVNEKKDSFFSYLRPSIQIENNRIIKERKHLRQWADSDLEILSAEDHSYAKRLGKLYSLPVPVEGLDRTWLSEMLNRVNVLPEALVLSQAANESAWGTSRFAKQANNYFGQWCYSKGCGLVPLQRNEGSTHEVAKFSSSQESVHRYFMNINRNLAYKELRGIRSDLSDAEETLLTHNTATQLANGLLKYSERGSAYVEDLQAMIRHNQKYWAQ
ncbi:glucosaminidase domain-containing protein [Vibrio sp. 99-70-13A1]|uniref:glucosaminidase domain-containing protein n=1 Tax=Vibrio sp. 99-70-13A1 TaxID=2607601 RepID=UPI00149372AF|nr:glucosaminidase domain-containing protein [Vibrio sp. 99-70-13A1]NOH96314.1 glucosaminidase [Vibrio sp. 99-70-13A1]